MNPDPRVPDVTVSNHGTILLFTPQNDTARQWIYSHVDPSAQWFGSSLAVEHRYATWLASGMRADGLTVSEE